MDQKEGKEEQADCGRGGEMQSAAVSAEEKGEPGDPPPTAAQVRVRYSVCALVLWLGLQSHRFLCVSTVDNFFSNQSFCALTVVRVELPAVGNYIFIFLLWDQL